MRRQLVTDSHPKPGAVAARLAQAGGGYAMLFRRLLVSRVAVPVREQDSPVARKVAVMTEGSRFARCVQ